MTNKQNPAPFDKMMIIRTTILLLAWINQFLVMKGYKALPITNEDITFIITLLISIWAWWKNNDVRYKARRNTQYLKDRGLK
ncbi:phage holin [Psychrobacillus sp. FSL H8-0483]|uniref:phage holin n=1 Tax=Psychrobacillus sp. FSL H8-0483 TaxID=2921389 RepID=UPI00315AB62A